MQSLMNQLLNDEAGFIVSAELILISTIAVLSMVVGLSEVASGINQELEDVGSAFGSINQSFMVSGNNGHKGNSTGSLFNDNRDFCDNQGDITCSSAPQHEGSGN
jgi:Flp pilus assembly pilin Flp